MHKRRRILATLVAASLLALPGHVYAHTTKKMMVGVRVLAPAPGAVIHGNTVHLRVAFSHWKLNCAWAGKANKAGVGHYHVLLDGALINMFCGKTAAVSMQNVT
ncbi:MAG: hypothetical protein ACRDFX_05465, partial [Chloroflexota bacterium]